MRRLVVAAVAVAGCAGAPPLPPPPPSPPPVAGWPASPAPATPVLATPDAPFRESPPPAGPAVVWSPPKVESFKLASGVRVLFVERHDLPVVSVRVVTSLGAGDQRTAPPAAIAFAGSLLEQGAGSRDALKLADDFAALGASHGAGCDWDSCGAYVKVLTSHLAPALDLLADVVLRPTFPDAEVDRARKRWLVSQQSERSSPPTMEVNALAAAVYGRGHPYGHTLRGVATDVEKVTRADAERIYRATFAPPTTTVAVAGDVTSAELRGLLEARFGSWRGRAAVRAPVPPAPAAGATRVVLVDSPGAPQSQVYVAAPGVALDSPDRIPLQILNLILGGLFSSRINLELREARAYTYGVHSGFRMHHGAGPFAAGGPIFAEHTVDAATELLAQIRKIRDEPVRPEELADAKDGARLALPARFETVDEVTGALGDLAVYGLPLDEFAQVRARIDAVTVADVQRVARKWLHPDSMKIVVTGDRSRLEKDLARLGRVEVRDAYGDLALPEAAGGGKPSAPPRP